MTPPMVSVIMSSFNHELFIVECLRSLVAQDYQRIEVCLLDNCSADKTFKIASEFLMHHEARFDHVHFAQNSENIGVTASLNKALGLCSSDFVFTLFTDDYLEPDCISTFVSHAIEHPGFDGLYTCDSFRVSTESKILSVRHAPISAGLVAADEFFESLFSLGSRELQVLPFFCSRSALLSIGQFDERYHSLEWDLYIRFNARRGIYHIDRPLFNFRVTPGSAGSRVFEYADGMLMAVDDLKGDLGDRYELFRYFTMRRILRVFFGNFYFMAGIKRTYQYALQISFVLRIRIIMFSILEIFRYGIKRLTPPKIAQLITFKVKDIFS